MPLKTHIGYDVFDIDESINFYQKVFDAKLEFKNPQRKSASLTVGGSEVNLFQREGFGGYHSSILKAMHIGFQLPSQVEVDEVYERAQKFAKTVFQKPYLRFDGDYAFFIQDPDGMQLEVYFGNHDLER